MRIYKILSNGSLLTPEGKYIPADSEDSVDEAGRMWSASREEEIAGVAEIIPYSAPPTPVPAVVTMRQARLALLSTGRLTDVETAIAGMTEPDKTAATIEWEYSQTVERDRPFVTALAGLLSLTETDLDDLFTLAATL